MSFTGPAEDRLAIRELLEAYADAVTRWEMPDYPEFPPQKGKAAIVGLWVEAMKGFPGIMFEAWPGSIEINGETATMRSYTSEVYDQDGITKRDRGVYQDECIKVGGKWLFKKRIFRNIHRQHGPKGV
jgi:SnoaL-like domain